MPAIDATRQRAFAIEVVRRLRDAGYEALLAGGCVRDQLLGRVPKDYDVATNATPPQVRALFGRRKTLEVGAAFGVVIVVGPPEAGSIDVATFRRDVAYSDGRRPDEVQFTDAAEDARRRDFTINGLFFDPLENKVLDYVDGQADLRQGIVRAIGDPAARFTEDKLRMLRAVRFTATFAFALDRPTEDAVKAMAGQITVVSAERIAQEMRRMLQHPSRTRALELLYETGLLAEVLPELAALRAQDEAGLWNQTLRVLAALCEPSFPLALAAAVHAVDGPIEGGAESSPASAAQMAVGVCLRWRLSNDEQERVVWLVRHQDALVSARALPWPRLQRLLIANGIEELLHLTTALAIARGDTLEEVLHCRAILAQPRGEWDPPPLVTGDDLIAHGLRPGKRFKSLLDQVRDAQLEREIATRSQALALVDRLLAEGGVEGG
jgi:poly(A) polymerase